MSTPALPPRSPLLGVAILLLAGCAGSRPAPTLRANPDEAVNTGLARLLDPNAPPTPFAEPAPDSRSELETLTAQAAADLESVFRERARSTPQARPSEPSESHEPAEAPRPEPAPPAPGAAAPARIVEAPPPAPPRPPESAEEQRIRLAGELSNLVRQRAAAAINPFADELLLALLEPLAAPEALPRARARHDDRLSPAETASLDAARSLFGDLTRGSASAGDPESVLAAVNRAAESLAPLAGVRIKSAALCSRVLGYGRFEPLRSDSFQAGRRNRAILYVELDRFSHRPARSSDPGRLPDDAWAVELSQELELRLDADGSLQWKRAEQTVIEASRNKRRDFYLIDEIELPPTLSVGEYTLKVIIRDKGAANPARAEELIRIRVVADLATARER